VTDSYIYTADSGLNGIWRFDLDGTNATELVDGLSSPMGLAIIPEPSAPILLGLAFSFTVLLRRKRDFEQVVDGNPH
jgi:hypothetical protein